MCFFQGREDAPPWPGLEEAARAGRWPDAGAQHGCGGLSKTTAEAGCASVAATVK